MKYFVAHCAMKMLEQVFDQINQKYFDGFLEPPALRWNSRLRTSAGRFIPGSRRFFRVYPPTIEIAAYLKSEESAQQHIADTMAHEMIHYWLWVRRRPYGHSEEFYSKMEALGVSRYNPVPRVRPYRYVYACGVCNKEFPARRRLGVLACAKCCKMYANGRYDAKFQLTLKGAWSDGGVIP